MDKITIEVPEGEYCKGCQYLWENNGEEEDEAGCDVFCDDEGNCQMLEYGEDAIPVKCPACISAIKAYKETHDYEKAKEKIDHVLDDHIEFTIDTQRNMILKALGYKEKP